MIAATTRAHLRASAEAAGAYVVSVAARDLLDLLDATEPGALPDHAERANQAGLTGEESHG